MKQIQGQQRPPERYKWTSEVWRLQDDMEQVARALHVEYYHLLLPDIRQAEDQESDVARLSSAHSTLQKL